MEYQRFEGQMKRLAAAYRVEVPAATTAAYWTVFAPSDASRFASACERALETERTFPPPAALKAIMRTAAEIELRGNRPVLPNGTTPPCDFDFDAPRVARPVVHAPGSAGHRGFVANSAALIAILERKLSARMAEQQHDANPDLARRINVLGRTLSKQYEWHEHFERTGESLVWGAR